MGQRRHVAVASGFNPSWLRRGLGPFRLLTVLFRTEEQLIAAVQVMGRNRNPHFKLEFVKLDLTPFFSVRESKVSREMARE